MHIKGFVVSDLKKTLDTLECGAANKTRCSNKFRVDEESNDENDEDDGIANVINNERKYVTAKAQASSSLTSGVISPSTAEKTIFSSKLSSSRATLPSSSDAPMTSWSSAPPLVR